MDGALLNLFYTIIIIFLVNKMLAVWRLICDLSNAFTRRLILILESDGILHSTSFVGWGTERFNFWGTAKPPKFLQQANVPIVDYKTCAEKSGDLVHDDTMVCIGGQGKGACHGDRYYNIFICKQS